MTQVGVHPGASTVPVLEGPVPNPANGTATLKFIPGPGTPVDQAELLVTDTRGNVVLKLNAGRETALVIPVSDLPAGVYFCRILGTFGTTEVKKLIVIH
jgi:hypothetical protein